MARSLSLQEPSLSLDEQLIGFFDPEEEREAAAAANSSQAQQNLGVTILASRFAANTRRGAQKMRDVELPKLQKPEEPDFSVEPDDD